MKNYNDINLLLMTFIIEYLDQRNISKKNYKFKKVPRFFFLFLNVIRKEEKKQEEGTYIKLITCTSSTFIMMQHVGTFYSIASAEGCHLALFSYDDLKAEKSRKPPVNVSCASRFSQDK